MIQRNILFAAMTLVATVSFGATIQVPSQQPTIQAAVNAASNGDTVLVAPGTYSGSGNLGISFSGKSVTVRSSGGPYQTIFDLQGSGPLINCVEPTPTTPTLDGFTIKNNLGSIHTIRCIGSSLTVTHCLFINNFPLHAIVYFNGNPSQVNGAAQANLSPSPAVKNCTFIGNGAEYGVVYMQYNQVSTTISGCIFADNSNAGAVVQAVSTGDFTISCSDVYDNASGDWIDDLAAYANTGGNMSQDPLFVDVAKSDYHLQSSSPCTADHNSCGLEIGPFGSDKIRSIGLADGGSMWNIVSQQPQFEWQLFHNPDYLPVAFEIAVGSDNDWTNSSLWNPAPFNSSDTFVTYAGAPLIIGQTYHLRLRISNGVSWSNWYYTSFHMNTPPTAPVPYAPQWPNITVSTTPDLSVVNATDAENDTLAYDFEIYYDSMLTQLAVASPHVAETHNPDSTSWTVTPPLTDNKYYYWQARAFDGYEYSPWSSMRFFIADNTNEPPNPFTLLDPPDSTGSILYNRKPTFRWTYTGDPDPYNQVRYKLELAVDPAFTFKQVIDSLYTSFWIPPDSLPYHSHYWWRVSAIDQHGATTLSPNVKEFWVWTLGDVDHSNNVDIADLSRLIDYLYISFGPIDPRKVGDLDGDCTVDIADLSRMIDYLYLSLVPLDIGGCGP